MGLGKGALVAFGDVRGCVGLQARPVVALEENVGKAAVRWVTEAVMESCEEGRAQGLSGTNVTRVVAESGVTGRRWLGVRRR